jgi:hypothetical protein
MAKQSSKQQSTKETKSYFSEFSWTKLIYTLIVIFLYVPMVFLGVRTFLPEYTDYYEYPVYKDCYGYAPYSEESKCYDADEQAAMVEKRDQCVADQQADQKAYDEAKREYDTWKYLSVLGVAVVTLVLVMFLGFDVPIKVGLFIGSAAAVFIGTMQYFETESIPAFLVLFVVFCVVVYVIQKREKFF